jgi:cell division protein FtsN
MSDDQSFYEIQLNTPHLVLAFLGAAVVGVALFWLGVVIGRGQGEAGGLGAPEWQAAVPGDSSEASGGEDPLEFQEAVSEPVAQGGSAAPTETTERTPTPQPESALAAPEFQPAEPVDEQRAQVVAESPEGLPTPDASLASGWIVQVRSTTEKAEADSLQAALAGGGFPAFVVSADVSGQTFYRVRVGRYSSRGDAEVIEAELKTRSDIEATWVTEG